MINKLQEALDLINLTESFIKENTSSDERSIRDLLADEQNAVRKYEELAVNTLDKRVEKVMLDIAREELVHSGELEKLLDVLGMLDNNTAVEGANEVTDLIGESKIECAELEGIPSYLEKELLIKTLKVRNEEIVNLNSSLDNAYSERAILVSFVSRLFPSVLYEDPKDDSCCNTIVYINSPTTGQMSWHINKRDLYLFKHLQYTKNNIWDGHDTETKYKRLLDIAEN